MNIYVFILFVYFVVELGFYTKEDILKYTFWTIYVFLLKSLYNRSEW